VSWARRLEAASPGSGGSLAADLVVLGIPFNGDGTAPDVENPARAVREAGLLAELGARGVCCEDRGDLPIPAAEGRRDPKTGILNVGAWQEVTRRTLDAVRPLAREAAFPLVLGGDCGLLVGLVGAFAREGRPVGLVSLDGHADCRLPWDSPTGEPADLPLSILTGWGPEEMTHLVGAPPLLEHRDIVVCGYREPDRIEETAIPRLDGRAVRARGPAAAARWCLEALSPRPALWLHLDVDVLDPSVMPVLFPEADGLTLEELGDLVGRLLRSGRIVGLDVACYHPSLDPGLTAARRLVRLLADSLASRVAPA
jgi:arginase